MTTQPDTDPRIGALMDLTQGLILKYTELASNVAAHLPDEARAELIEHTQTLVEEARARYEDIALMTPRMPVGEYVLSTRPRVVSGGS
ncbi:hypothetical protein [Streptomyces europaeiscabiei]|uniref:hypothetical protein n=1 Tax=Streptomyces europaeiscabiei TaxID=146819 RepID=UPI0029B02E2B|nr:hypothetical protein [Streptomyces europaeiscabiei]MDX3839534.1 hypothetical protein [Streptomyces europaeiscabiei]